VVEIEIDPEKKNLVLEMEGLDKLWTLRSHLEIPLANVLDVHLTDPDIVKGWWKGVRAPGIHIPDSLVAGTFYQDGKRIFWDVKSHQKAIVIDLKDERYNELIVEVENPAKEVEQIKSVIAPRIGKR
jgi:hypothetical protein